MEKREQEKHCLKLNLNVKKMVAQLKINRYTIPNPLVIYYLCDMAKRKRMTNMKDVSKHYEAFVIKQALTPTKKKKAVKRSPK